MPLIVSPPVPPIAPLMAIGPVPASVSDLFPSATVPPTVRAVVPLFVQLWLLAKASGVLIATAPAVAPFAMPVPAADAPAVMVMVPVPLIVIRPPSIGLGLKFKELTDNAVASVAERVTEV